MSSSDYILANEKLLKKQRVYDCKWIMRGLTLSKTDKSNFFKKMSTNYKLFTYLSSIGNFLNHTK